MPHVVNTSILRAYDIRGIFGETLTLADADLLARAFAVELLSRGGKNVCIAYDVRPSSPLIEETIVHALITSGIDVIRVGLGPSPMLYFAQKYLQTDAGLMITGSHNPTAYNGIKLCLKSGPFWGEDIQRLGRLANAGQFATGQGQVTSQSVMDAYIDHMMTDYRQHYASGRPLKVVWDPANGAACLAVEQLIKHLPGDHIVINSHMDGSFPSHHPDPCVLENVVQLSAAVREHAYDIGIGFDGDGDRIGVVDGAGRLLMGDQLLAYYAEELAKTHPGAVILGDVKSSKVLFDRLNQLGLRGQMIRTGHSYIKSCMRDLHCPLAGEMSGHMFFADRYYGYDDALYGALRLIGSLSLSPDSLASWLDAYPQTFVTPEHLYPCPDEKKFDCIEAIKQDLTAQGIHFVDVDGIRVTTPDGWWLLRASNTQAVIVSRAESLTKEGLQRLQLSIESHLQKQGIRG
jgi:phosphomannomutase